MFKLLFSQDESKINQSGVIDTSVQNESQVDFNIKNGNQFTKLFCAIKALISITKLLYVTHNVDPLLHVFNPFATIGHR